MIRFTGLILGLAAAAASGTARADGLISVDAESVVSRADLNYSSVPERIEAGLPIGNGRTGSLLWTLPNSLNLQINRNDVFGSDSTSRSFPERHTDYMGGCAGVSVVFGKSTIFPKDKTTEKLSCYTGLAAIRGEGVTVEGLAWVSHDVLALRIDDRRENPDPIDIVLRMLRPAVVKTVAQTATSVVASAGDRVSLTQRFEEGSYYCSSAVVVAASGRSVSAQLASDLDIRLTAAAGKGSFTVLISSAATFDRATDIKAVADKELSSVGSRGFSELMADNASWWADFWARSFVHLHSSDGVADKVEANYTYFLYNMGASSRGLFPTKFNGMLWSNGGDRRQWGSQFWGANQSCFYNNSLFAAGVPELMDPMFDMYTGMIASCEQAAREEWGSKGIYFPETVAFDGLAHLPDAIASEMQELYLMRKPWSERSPQFMEFANGMSGYSSRWNWIAAGKWVDGKWTFTERGGGPYGPTSHILSRGAKIAYQYWLKYEYSGDKAWLRDRAYPVLKGVAEFYRNFPNVRKEADGLYHIHYVNSNEPLWGALDTDEEISSMHAIFSVVLRASSILGVDSEERPVWQEFLDHLAPMPTADRAGKTVWIKGRDPAVHGMPGGLPDSNTLPVWFFDMCTLESPADVQKIANATLDSFVGGANPRRRGMSILSKLPLAAATLGKADAVQRLIPAEDAASGAGIMENRMDESEGKQSTNIERLGNAADAVHTALCSDLPAGPGEPSVIRVFPAWSASWDADFSLHCRGAFVVSSVQKSGHVEFVSIQSEIGGDCRLRNPWGENPVDVYRGAQKEGTHEGGLLTLSTRAGENLVVVQAGEDPAQFKEKVSADPIAVSTPHGNSN